MIHLAAGELGMSVDQDVVAAEISTGPSALRVKFGSESGLTIDGPETGLGLDFLELAVGDMDGDGRDDVIALVSTPGLGTGREVDLFLRGPNDDFSEVVRVGVDGVSSHLAVGQLDGDGKADLLVYPNNETGVDVLLSR